MEHGWNPEETALERRKIADGVKQRTHNELYPLFVNVADDDDGGVSWSGRSSSRKRVEIWRKLYCTGFQDLLYGLLCILWTTFSNFTFMWGGHCWLVEVDAMVLLKSSGIRMHGKEFRTSLHVRLNDRFTFWFIFPSLNYYLSTSQEI